jgi:excisionase family DNA binding protein
VRSNDGDQDDVAEQLHLGRKYRWLVGRQSGLRLMAETDRPRSRPILTGLDQPSNLARNEAPVPTRRPRRLMPIDAAADYLSVSRATIERLAYRGELPIVKVAGSTRYDVEDLDRFIAINRCRNRTEMA